MKSNDQHLFDNPNNIKRLLMVFYGCCVVLLGLDLVLHRHVEHSFERLIGFYPLYGFVGCVVLVMVAKWMRTFLMRPESYYEAEPPLNEIVMSDKIEHAGDHQEAKHD